jgi:T5SS/PEP-CTERM-associated repeat protein
MAKRSETPYMTILRTSRSCSCLVLLAVSGVLAFSPSIASAQTSFWSSDDSGEFFDASRWTSGVPIVGEGRFARGAAVAYSVSFPLADETVAAVAPISIGSNDVTLTSTSPTHFRVGGGLGEEGRGLVVGKLAGDDATLNMDLYRFHTSAVTIGDAAGSRGVINLSESDATLMVSGGNSSGPPEFIVGRYGAGILHVTGGGAANIFQQSTDATLGLYEDSEGTANILGRNANMYVGGLLTVGDQGRGAMTLADGGTLQANRNTVIGSRAGGVGDVTVSNGVWVNWRDIHVGSFGEGRLTIEKGGSVQSREAQIGIFGASAGVVTVDGANSLWQVLVDMSVGMKGSGKLNVTNGGAVEAYRVQIGPLGEAAGDGLITGDVINRGVVAPGSTFALLTIEGNYQQLPTGALKLELASIDAYDKLKVTGAIELAGRLSIEAGPGFVPSAGRSFDVLDFASAAGTFDAIDLPALPTGLAWNTAQLYSAGSISIDSTLAGDFDGDGDVDRFDLATWRGDFGENGGSDGDGDGVSDGADFLVWQRHYGGEVSLAASVPEPSTGLLLAAGAVVASMLKVRRAFERGGAI